jgi:hypothetical protein
MAVSDPTRCEENRTFVRVARRGGSVLLAALLVVSTLAAVGAAAVPAAVDGPGQSLAADQCDTTADEAVAAQNRSEELVGELQGFAAESPVVDDEAVRSAAFHFDRGESHFRNSRYCAAVDKFRIAENRARAELVRAYRVEATLLLNASAAQLADAGGDNSDRAALRTRIEDTRSKVASADSLASARSAYREARELHRAVGEASGSARVWLAGNLVVPTVGGGVVLVVLGAVVGAFARSRVSGGPIEWKG